MINKLRKRIGLLAYFTAGTAVGLYLVHLLAAELGTLVVRQGIESVLPAALAAIGWFIVPLYAATRSWRLLFPPGTGPAPGKSAELTWIGLSVNWLLPAALVGGELVKLRLALRRSPDSGSLVASLVGDKTIQVATQLVYTLLGLSILAWESGRVSGGLGEAAGFLAFAGVVYLFYRVQRVGLFARAARPLGRLARDRVQLGINAARIDAAIDEMYQRRGRLWRSAGWRLAFRLLMAGEVALVFWWLGYPVELFAVLALESMAQASRVAALVIPAAIGAQEAVIVTTGLLLGCPPEALIGVAVVKRIRELGVGGTGLAAWQFREVRAFARGGP